MRKLLAILGTVLVTVSQVCNATPPPPRVIELTIEEMATSGFYYNIVKQAGFSSINLKFPERLYGTHTPRTLTITTYDDVGKILHRSDLPAPIRTLSLTTSLYSAKTHVSLTLTYCRDPVEACIAFRISSVSTFINENTP